MKTIYLITSNLRRTNFSHFSELKIRVRLKFEVLCFFLRNPQQLHFARRTSGLAETVINLMDSKMCVLENSPPPLISLFESGAHLQLACVLNSRAY